MFIPGFFCRRAGRGDSRTRMQPSSNRISPGFHAGPWSKPSGWGWLVFRGAPPFSLYSFVSKRHPISCKTWIHRQYPEFPFSRYPLKSSPCSPSFPRCFPLRQRRRWQRRKAFNCTVCCSPIWSSSGTSLSPFGVGRILESKSQSVLVDRP